MKRAPQARYDGVKALGLMVGTLIWMPGAPGNRVGEDPARTVAWCCPSLRAHPQPLGASMAGQHLPFHRLSAVLCRPAGSGRGYLFSLTPDRKRLGSQWMSAPKGVIKAPQKHAVATMRTVWAPPALKTRLALAVVPLSPQTHLQGGRLPFPRPPEHDPPTFMPPQARGCA